MSGDDISAAQRREHPEPREQAHPVPWLVVALAGALTLFGIAYILAAAVDTPAEWGDGRARAELSGPAPAAAGAAVDGAAVYASHCAACHQADGKGLAGVFPPLAGSEWVAGSEHTLAAIVLQGVSGELGVQGVTYRGAMPSFKAQLGDAQIAAVLTHLRAGWGNAHPAVKPGTVAKARRDLAERTAPLDGGKELATLP